MGKRKGLGTEDMHPHNLTMTALGTGLLWFGWFGFNAGSALAANTSAVAAFVNTNTAAAAATRELVADRVARTRARRPCWAPARAPSPAWSRSRPPPGSSRRWGRWPSACSSRASATARSCSRASSATTTRSTSSASTASAGSSARSRVGVFAKAGDQRQPRRPALRQPEPARSSRRSRSSRRRRTASSSPSCCSSWSTPLVGLRVTDRRGRDRPRPHPARRARLHHGRRRADGRHPRMSPTRCRRCPRWPASRSPSERVERLIRRRIPRSRPSSRGPAALRAAGPWRCFRNRAFFDRTAVAVVLMDRDLCRPHSGCPRDEASHRS